VITQQTDPQFLQEVEDAGYSFAEVMGAQKAVSNFELYQRSSNFQKMANTISTPLQHDSKTDQLPKALPPSSGDIPEMVGFLRGFEDLGARSDKDLTSGFKIQTLSNNSQYPYSIEYDGDEPRHFDPRWLQSKFANFKLIGVVNRLDRMDFDLNFCGEVRLIYRLSYQSPKSSSSLPFFANFVLQAPKEKDCQVWAALWNSDVMSVAHLKNAILKKTQFKQLEISFQSLRFTSGYMHDFGGQAMYMQRTFRKGDGEFEAVGLENTPDVLYIEKNPELLKEFVEYLKVGKNLEKLDQGILQIDFNKNFLAKLAISWSTLGRARSANKPYTRLFEKNQELLRSIDLSKLKFIKSHEALVERLNNMTCMGCHQSSGTAGFHFLGRPGQSFSHHFNRQQLAFSLHSYAENLRRQYYVNNVAQNEKPNPFRPHSNFPEAIWTGGDVTFTKLTVGQQCLLSSKHFGNTPQCQSGLVCKDSVRSKDLTVLFGECVDETEPWAGSACWQGEIAEVRSFPKDREGVPSFNFFAFQDKFKISGALKQNSNYKCVLPQSGAPLGRSNRDCSSSEETYLNLDVDKKIPDEICANQGGNGFDLCAATGDSGACLESRVVRSMLDTCYPGKFCREDYICQSLPNYHQISEAHYSTKKNGKKLNLALPKQIRGALIEKMHRADIGFCVPTYFLFNMRLDGHPSPVTGLPPGQPRVDRSQPVRGYKK
jgi:hypothetical protein